MKVKELIKQLLDEDLESDIVIKTYDGKNIFVVDIDGISSLYRVAFVENMKCGSIVIEPTYKLESPIK